MLSPPSTSPQSPRPADLHVLRSILLRAYAVLSHGTLAFSWLTQSCRGDAHSKNKASAATAEAGPTTEPDIVAAPADVSVDVGALDASTPPVPSNEVAAASRLTPPPSSSPSSPLPPTQGRAPPPGTLADLGPCSPHPFLSHRARARARTCRTARPDRRGGRAGGADGDG
jgi:hypothetical protein